MADLDEEERFVMEKKKLGIGLRCVNASKRKKEGMRLNLQKNISQVSMVRGNFSLGPGKEAREG